MTGLSVKCKASWWMSIAFAILPPRMPLSLMKPVGGPGRVWLCSVLKLIFKTMASLKDSSLTPLLHGMLSYVELHPLRTLTIPPPRQLWKPKWSMMKTMLLHRHLLQHASTLLQALQHRQTPLTTLLLHLLLMGTSRCSMSSNLFGHYWQKGEKHMRLIVFKRVHMGGCFIFLLRAYNSRFATFGSLSCNT